MAFYRYSNFADSNYRPASASGYPGNEYVIDWQNIGGGYMMRDFPNVLAANRIEFSNEFRNRIKYQATNMNMVQNIAYEWRVLNNFYDIGGDARFNRQATGISVMLWYYSDITNYTPGSGQEGDVGTTTFSYDPNGWRLRILLKDYVGAEIHGGSNSYYTLTNPNGPPGTAYTGQNALRNGQEPRAGRNGSYLYADVPFTMWDPQQVELATHGAMTKTMSIVLTKSGGSWNVSATINGRGVNTPTKDGYGSVTATSNQPLPADGTYFGFIGNGTRQSWERHLFFVNNIRLKAT